MKERPTVVILQGHPCTGKTSLLRLLGTELRLPSVSRDEFKELLFNELGTGDRNWSIKLGKVSFELFFNSIEKLFLSGKSFIIETNFDPLQHRNRIEKALKQHEYRIIEVILEARPEVLISRFRERWESGERHRGHVDHTRFGDLQQRLLGDKLEPLRLGGKLVQLDTSNFETVSWADFFTEIQKALVSP